MVTSLFMEAEAKDCFIGTTANTERKAIYGGQVLAQALNAAQQTLPEGFSAHSLHGYFMRTGLSKDTVEYRVRRLRDGRSFATREVMAIQGGKEIFSMLASFQVAESGLDHSATMPDVPGPEGLANDFERYKKIPGSIRSKTRFPWPFENRTVAPLDFVDPAPAPAQRCMWFRALEPIPQVQAVQQVMLAFASDTALLETALMPHGMSHVSEGLQMASVDHALWFHRPFDVNDWLLYQLDSPNAGQGRGLAFGKVFNRRGELVASTAQEGLIRLVAEGGGRHNVG